MIDAGCLDAGFEDVPSMGDEGGIEQRQVGGVSEDALMDRLHVA